MSTKHDKEYPRLLADVGGTNVRYALEVAPRQLEHVEVLATKDYPSLLDATRHYLGLVQAEAEGLAHAAIGIANPVLGDYVQMTNHNWEFSIEEVRSALELDTFLVLNDFTALAHSLPHLPENELAAVGCGTGRPDTPRLLIGPGTGLGVSALWPTRAGAMALAGEGGHVSFTPFNDEEVELWKFMRSRFGHVSAERLISGSGLSFIHAFQTGAASAHGLAASDLVDPAKITERALNGEDEDCLRAVNMFCGLLGTIAADFALMLGALGGVYIGGGIIPKLGDAFVKSPFRSRFEDKGRFSAYLCDIPVWVIHTPQPALIGLSAALADKLDRA